MKTLVGVDLGGRFQPVLQTCLDLNFAEQKMLFVNTVEAMPEYAPPMHETTLDSGMWMQHLREAGHAAVEKAEASARAEGLETYSVVVDGSPVANLMTLADSEHVDLIAVGSAQRSMASGFLFGSVARGLAIGAKQSILVTKQEGPAKPPTRAIFATDYSDYANRCIEKLVQWAPRGISYIDVVTAFEVNSDAAAMLGKNLPDMGADVEHLIEEHLNRKGAEVAGKLTQAGYLSRPHVRKGHPNRVLRDLMEETEATLLIMGAQGHGFLERLFIGSISLHQVVAEQYPVLLLRS